MFNYQELVELDIQKLVFGGQALAHQAGETFFVWNALPGEKVKARILHRHKKIYEAVVEEIIKPSADRLEAREDHHLSCSPWQIMSPELELKLRLHVSNKASTIATPQAIVFCEGLPKNKSGKIMRRVLKARYTGAAAGDLSTMEEEA